MKRSLFYFLLLTLLGGTGAFGQTILRVNQAATGSAQNGQTWGTAFTKLEDAIAAAQPTANQPVEIWVAKGTYKPTSGTDRSVAFRLKSYLTIRGGFKGNETTPYPRTPWGYPTVLSGDIGAPMVGAVTDSNTFPSQPASKEDAGWADNSYNVLVGNGVTGVVLEYVTVTGGSATDASIPAVNIEGYAMYSANPSIPGAQSVVKPSSTVVGGGLYFTTGASWTEATETSSYGLRLLGCQFIRNRARGYGGGVGVYDALALISECQFQENVSDGSAGAFWGGNQQSGFTTTDFTDNTSQLGGGAVSITSVPSFESSDGLTSEQRGLNDFLDLFLAGPSLSSETREKANGRISKAMSDYGIYKAAANPAALVSNGANGLFASVAGQLTLPISKDDVKLITKSVSNAEDGKNQNVEIEKLGGSTSLKTRAASLYGSVRFSNSVVSYFTDSLKRLGVLQTDNQSGNWGNFNSNFLTNANPEAVASGNFLTDFLSSGHNPDRITPNITAMKLNALKNYYTQAGRSAFSACRFSGNQTQSVGGAIELVFNNLLVESCKFTDNRAVTDGAAISSSIYCIPQVVSSLFSNNFSDQGTSAIATSLSSIMFVANCTIVNNKSFDNEGVALSAIMGGDVRVFNSILWNNASATKSAGADIFALTRDAMDTATQARFDALQNGQQGNWVGIMDIRNSTVQSLQAIPLGVDKLNMRLESDPLKMNQVDIDAMIAHVSAERDEADANGELESVGAVNAGSGVRPKLRDAAYGNNDADPGLLAIPLGKPNRHSPVYNAGDDRWSTGRLIDHATTYANLQDVAYSKRVVNSRVDIGAYELDPSKPDTYPQLAGQPGADSDAPLATGQGAGAPPIVSANTPPGTTVYYVKPVASGNGSGSSWINATADLQSAISHANAEVWVAAGTYKPSTADRNASFSMADGVKIFGGFVGGETQRSARNWKANVTTISGDLGVPGDFTDNSQNLFRNTNVSSSAILDGFTLRDAHASNTNGGAILNYNSAPLIRNCVFRFNHALNGGAIACDGLGADPIGSTLVNCEFYNNSADQAGGAVRYSESLFGYNLTFSGNTALNGGGAISVAGTGTAQYCTVENSLFTGNSSTAAAGGAISSRGLYLNVLNSTFYGNTAAITSSTLKSGGGAIDHAFATSSHTASAVILNSIFYKNTATNNSNGGLRTMEIRQIQSADPVLLSHSLVQGLSTYAGGEFEANLDGDPQFVTEGSDFHLQARSLAVNAGDSSDIYTEKISADLDGNPRPFDTAIDLGPYELTAAAPAHPVTQVTQTSAAATGDSETESHIFSSSYLPVLGDTVQWYVDRGDGLGFVALVEDPTENVGVRTGTLTVLSPANGFSYRLQVTHGGVIYTSPISRLLPPADSRYVFVKPVATGDGTGTSWPDAMDLQTALNKGDAYEIWVAQGVYRPTTGTDRNAHFSITGSPKIRGGFAVNEMNLSKRDWRAHKTIISGEIGAAAPVVEDNSKNLLVFSGGSHADLDGFYFQDAYGDGVDGGAINSVGSSPKISNCVFTTNHARNGGAISSMGVSHDDVFGPRLGYCEFQGNTAELKGGALYYVGSLNSYNLLFKGNTAQTGGAVYVTGEFVGQSITFENSLFVGNQSTAGLGGAVVADNTSLYANSCTFYGNQASINSTGLASGGAIYLDHAAGTENLISNNSIFYKNTALNTGTGGRADVELQQIGWTGGRGTFVRNTLVPGLDVYTANSSGTNIDADPGFVAEGTDFHLSAGSVAIDAGADPDDLNFEMTDLDGEDRIRGAAIDFGAYEHAALAVVNPLRTMTSSSSGLENYTFTVQYTPQAGDQLQWYVDRGDGNGFVVLGSKDRPIGLAPNVYVDPATNPLPVEYVGINTTSLTVLSPPSGYRFQLRLVQNNTDIFYSPVKQLKPTPLSKGAYVYVRPTATGDGSGTGWSNATSDLQAAMAKTNAEVWVQEGTYCPTSGTDRDKSFSVTTWGVRVYGGFKGGESLRVARNPASNVTRISGAIGGPEQEDNSRHLFKNETNFGSFGMDGFTFEDAYGDGVDGGAVYNNATSPTFQNCLFQNNYARNGGAIFSTGASDFRSGSQFIDCKFKNNTAEVAGGAISSTAAHDLINVVFEGNQAATGGAISLSRNSDRLAFSVKNGLFFNNRALDGNGGAICSSGLSVYTYNTTFYGNQSQLSSASKLGGGAIYVEGSTSNATVSNSIFYLNTCVNPGAGGLGSFELQQIIVKGSYVSASHSLIQGLNEYANTASYANFDESPAFVNAATGNFHLSNTSGAINAGAGAIGYGSTSLPETDLDGNSRILGGVVDLGPYENTTTAALGRVTSNSDFASGVPRFLKNANVVVQSGDVLQWYVDRGNGIWVLLTEDSVYTGVNSSTLTITSPPVLASGYKFRLQILRGGETLTSLPSQLTLPPDQIYVNAARVGLTADGKSWATAYGDLQQALKASGPGTTISVASGTYYPTTGTNTALAFRIPAGVSIYGGYVPGNAIRNPAQNPTILSGKLTGATNRYSYSKNVVRNQEGQGRTAVLDGFIIQDSYSSLVLNDGASPTIRHCVFQDNTSAGSDGSALAISNVNGANPLIAECQFLRNTSSSGGLVSIARASATIENSVFAHSTASYSSIILVQNGTLNLVHCTVADNTVTANSAGLYATDSTVTVSNSIFWNNKSAYSGSPLYDQAIGTQGGTITFQNSCIQGGTSLPSGNVATDPIFAEPTATVEYALAPYSPLVNAGSLAFPVSSNKDIAGNPRVFFVQPDMGAYELQRNIVSPVFLTSLPRSRTVYGEGGSVDFTVTWPSTTTFDPSWEIWKVVDGVKVPVSPSRYAIYGGTNGSATLRLNNISLADDGIKVVVKAFYYDSVLAQNTTLYTPPATLTVRVPRIVRVNPAATGSNNGTSWENAYTDLTTALTNAQTADEIWVAKGTYTAGISDYFKLKPTVSIYGGFSGLGTEAARTDRNVALNPTILHAVDSNLVVYGAAVESEFNVASVLDGFIVENSTGPIAVYNLNASTTYRNCIFRNNAGSLINSQSQIRYEDCEFTGNTGALFTIDHSTVAFAGARITANTTTGDLINSYNASAVTLSDVVASNNTVAGAFLRNSSGAQGNSSATVLRSAFRGNSIGGAIIANGPGQTCAIESSLFAKNVATGDLATIQNSGTLSLVLSTVADNNGGSFGGGVYTYRGASTSINSCILWGNRGTRPTSTLEQQQTGDSAGTDGAGALAADRSIIEGTPAVLNAYSSVNNVGFYPLFADQANGDYHILASSPAASRASSNMTLLSATDLDKVAHRNVYGSAGAYESPGYGGVVLIAAYPSSVTTAETTDAGFTYTGQGTKQWQYFDGTSWVNITGNTSTYRVINDSATQTSTLYFDSPSQELDGTRYRLVFTLSGTTYTTGDLVLTVKHPETIYVNGGVTASGNGKSWATAFKTIQEALAVTNEYREIWVQAGTYAISNVNLSWKARLYGGFAGNETQRDQRDWANNEVALLGGGQRIFTSADSTAARKNKTNDAVLDGFTLTGAPAQTAVLLVDSDSAIRHCTFRGNAGAIAVSGASNPVISNCVFDAQASTVLSLAGDSTTITGSIFQNNRSSGGSTVYIFRGKVTIADSTFTGNTAKDAVVFTYSDSDATTLAYAMYSTVTHLTMKRCRLTGNTAYAGLYSTQTLVDLDNSLLARNTLTSSAIFDASRSVINLTNVVVADNTGTFECAGVQGSGTLYLANSIVWGNRTSWAYGQAAHPNEPASAILEYNQIKFGNNSDIKNSIIEGGYKVTYGANPKANSAYDPLFVDAGALDYHLTAASPAINVGISGGPGPDLDGLPRTVGSATDVGAYEFEGTAGTPVRVNSNLNSRSVIVGQTTQYTASVPAGVAVQWQVKSGGSFVNVVSGGNQTLSSGGSVLTLTSVATSMTGTEYRFVLSGDVSYTSAGGVLTVVPKSVIYVDATRTSGTQTGASWANAFTSVNDAVNAAANPLTGGPREIWVAQGTYVTDVSVPSGVDLYGGFAGTETARADRGVLAHPTILTQSVAAERVNGSDILSNGYSDPNKIGILIDGFTLTGTTSGITVYSAPVVVRNCTFSGLVGYGIVNASGPLTVEDCTFDQVGNIAVTSGPSSTTTIRRSTFQAGLATSAESSANSTVTIEDSVFRNNVPSDATDAVIYVSSGSTVNVTRSQFLKNHNASALYNDGRLYVRQTLIADNYGSGLDTSYRAEATQLNSATVAGNASYGIGIGYSNGSLRLSNSIVAGNNFKQIYTNSGGVFARYTLIQGENYSGEGTVSWDPFFVNAATGNYTLAARSPGIDAGETAAINSGETDLAGAARIQSSAPDMGAYESANVANPLYRNALPTSQSTTRGVDGVFSLKGASSYTYTWQYNNGGTWVDITYNNSTGQWEGPAGIPVNITTVNGLTTLTIPAPTIGANGLQFRVIINGQGVTSDPFTLSVAETEIMYVDASVTASGDGKSWGGAFKTLPEALTRIIPARRTIYIAKGTYKAPTSGFSIQQRAEIYGGFPNGGADFADRNVAANPVILSGEIGDLNSTSDNASPVLGISAISAPIAADTILDGVTIDGGKTGVTVGYNAAPTLRNLIFSHNTDSGLRIASAGGQVEDSQFLENSSTSHGGGASVSSSNVTFSRCVFRGNSAQGAGGGVYIYNGTVRLENAVISGNKSVFEGGGVSVGSGNQFLVNSTVVGNYSNGSSGGGGGGGLYVGGGNLAVWNSIVWANRSIQTSTNPAVQISVEAQQLSNYPFGASFNVQNSDIESLTAYGNAGGNFGVDPLFFSGIAAASAPTTAGDFHLDAGSPMVDKGSATLLNGLSLDVDKAPRSVRTVDIGAYELQGTVLALQPADLVYDASGSNQFQVQLLEPDPADTYQWESSLNGSAFASVTDGVDFAGAQTATLQFLSGNPALHGTVFRVKITTSSGVVTSRIASLTVYAPQYYVNAAAADDTGDGYTWATAFKTVSTALSKGRPHPTNGMQVWVAGGTYVTSATDPAAFIPLKSKVALYGGFAGTETALNQRDAAANVTTLQGLVGSTAIIASSGTAAITGARIDGFAINTGTNGISMGNNVAVTVANCSFSGLQTGINASADTITVQNSQFTGLTQYGIYQVNGSLSVTDSSFTSNKRGLLQIYGSLSAVRSVFRGNGAPELSGGGILTSLAAASIENCLFSGNYSFSGAGVYSTGGNVAVRNSTFAGNYGASGPGGLSFTGSSGNGILEIYNSILWGNGDQTAPSFSNQLAVSNTANVYLSNNNVQGAGDGVDPKFLAPVTASVSATTTGDYRLSPSSPMFNKGSNSLRGSSTTDLALATRTFDTTVDLGAYELQVIQVAVVTQPTSATAGVGHAVTFSAGSNNGGATYQWQVSTDGGVTWTNVVESASESGTTTDTLSVADSASFHNHLYRAHISTALNGDVFTNGATYFWNTVAVNPPEAVRGATLTGSSSTISFTIAGGALPASIVDGSFAVHAMQTGRLSLADGSLTGLTINGGTVSLQSTVPFKPGELVEVTTTSAVQRTDSFFGTPLVYQFRAGNQSRSGAFPASAAISGAPATARALAAGDLDGNGSNDLVIGGTNGAAVWLNNGTATFTATSQTLGSGTVTQALIGSLGLANSTASDKKLDVVLLKSTGDVEIWRNEGDGTFTNTSTITGVSGTSLGLADFNGDGALDLFIATAGADQVWFNDGAGTFTDSTQRLGTGAGVSVAVGDYNNDNSLDVFTANGSGSMEVWSNDKTGHFTTGPTLFDSFVNRVIATDLDKDRRLDLVTVRANGQIRFYRQNPNNGSFDYTNTFAPVGRSVADPTSLSVGDLDGDGFPDVVFPYQYNNNAIEIWRGQGYAGYGTMSFQQNGEQPTFAMARSADLVDLNGDGMMDSVFISASGVPTVAVYAGTPVAPTGLTAAPASDTSITLTWTDNATNETGFSVERSPNGNNNWTVIASTLPANSTSYTDSGRNAATTYFYRVRANVGGSIQSAYSNSASTASFSAISVGADAIAVLENATATTLVSGASSVLANDNSPDAGTFTAAVTVAPTRGSLTLNSDGTFSYTPSTGFSGSDSFTYRATNATTSASAGAVVSITVTRLNDAPANLTSTPTTGTHYTGQGAGMSMATFSATDSDPEDAGQLRFSLVSGAGSSGNGDFTISGATLKTANAIDASIGLTRSIRVRVTDSMGAFREENFTVTFTQAPTAAPATATGDEDMPFTGNLSGTGGVSALSYQVVSQPAHGTLTLNNDGTYSYTPTGNYNGSDSFTYRVGDGTLNSAPVTVTFDVAAVDDAPTLDTVAPVTTIENTPVSFSLVGHDVDGDAITSYQIVGTPSFGTVQMNGAVVTYTPNTSVIGTEALSFTVTAGGLTSAPLSVDVTTTPEPVALAVYRGLYEYSDLPAGSTGDWTGVLPTNLSTPAHGTVALVGSRLLYKHNNDAATSDRFTYTLTNGSGAVRHIGVDVTISDRVINVTSNADSGTGSLRAALDLTNQFVDEGILEPAYTTTLDWMVRIQPAAGTLATLTSATNYNVALGFYSYFRIAGKVTVDAAAVPGYILNTGGTHRARHFLVLPAASLTLKHLILNNGEANDRTYVGANAAPISHGGSILNFGSFTAQDVDFRNNRAGEGAAIYNDGGAISLIGSVFRDNFILLESDPGGIVVSRNGSTSFSGTTFTNTNLGKDGGDLTVTADGTTATVNVSSSTIGVFHLNTVNDGEFDVTGLLYTRPDFTLRLANTEIAIPVALFFANDAGGPFASFTVDSVSTQGVQLRLSSNQNTLFYPAAPGTFFDDTFTYTVTDDAGHTSTNTVTVSLPGDPYPHGNADSVTVYRGFSEDVAVLANDVDDRGNPLTISAVSAPAHGDAEIQGNRIHYVHGGDSSTSDSFTYSVSNGTKVTQNVTVTVTIADLVLDATSGADSGPGTLRAALNTVNRFTREGTQWKIRILAGSGQTWTLGSAPLSQDYFPDYRSAFTVTGNVVIDASGSPNFTLTAPDSYPFSAFGRLFLVKSGGSLALKNLTLAKGRASSDENNPQSTTTFGGGVLNRGTFSATNVTFRDNIATQGAALYNDGGTATLTNCTFTGNQAYSPFGGYNNLGIVASVNGTLNLNGVSINDYTANGMLVSALYVSGGTLNHSGENHIPSYQSSGSVTVVPGLSFAVGETFSRAPGKPLRISIASLLANDVNPVISSFTFDGTSSNGVTITRSGDFLLFRAPANNVGDGTFNYTLTDSLGLTTTATVTVQELERTPTVTVAPRNGGGAIVSLKGEPNAAYHIQVSNDLVNWSDVVIEESFEGMWFYEIYTDGGGNATWQDHDQPDTGGARFYRAERFQ